MAKRESTEADIRQEFVYIRRVPRNTRLGIDIMNKSRRKLSVFVKRNTLVLPEPIDSELGTYMYPKLLNVSYKDTSYAKAVEQFMLDTAWAVPAEEGLKLNITTINGLPAIPEDYIVYLVAKKHIAEDTGYVVENSKDGGGKALFFIYYPDAEKRILASVLDDEADAMFEMAKMFKSGEKDKIDWILSFFGHNPYVINDNDKKITMNDVIKGKANYSGEIKKDNIIIRYKERPAKYFELVCLDQNIELKSKLETLVREGIITIIGTKYYFGEIELGMTMDALVIRLLDKTPDSTNILRQIEAKYDVVKDELKSKKTE